MEIVIISSTGSWRAEIFDTPTGRLFWNTLPFKGRAHRWGQEIYFSVPVTAELEEGATEVVQPGDLGYWPPGKAFCIFFGPTPASRGNEIRAASAVNVFGRITGSLEGLDGVREGDGVEVKKA